MNFMYDGMNHISLVSSSMVKNLLVSVMVTNYFTKLYICNSIFGEIDRASDGSKEGKISTTTTTASIISKRPNANVSQIFGFLVSMYRKSFEIIITEEE